MMKDRILAVIPVHNRRETTLACLARLEGIRRDSFALDVLVIEDGSTDGTFEAIRERFRDVEVYRGDGTLWWGGGLNVGFRCVLDRGYDYAYTLNDDIEFESDTLYWLHHFASRHPRTICASVALTASDRIMNAGYTFSPFFHKLRNPYRGMRHAGNEERIASCDTLSTRSTLIPRRVFCDGLFIDTNRFPHNFSDLDFFERVGTRGYALRVLFSSVIWSKESSSNFHDLLVNKNFDEMWASFFQVKYAHNVTTLWNMALRNAASALGLVRFAHYLLPFAVWFGLKTVLPQSAFVRVLRRLGKISHGSLLGEK